MTASSGELTIPTVDIRSADFKTLAISVVLAIASSVVVAKVAEFVKLDTTLAGTLSQAALGSTVAYYHVISRRRGSGLLPKGIVPFTGFELWWPVPTVLGAFIIIASANAAAFVGGFLTGVIEGVVAASIVAAVASSFAVGRWIGIRASSHALLAAVVCAYLARFIGAGIDLALTPDDIKEVLGMGLTTGYLLSVLVGGGIWAVAAVLGSYVGRRAREAGYLAYLLRRIPAASRATVLELAYEESMQLRTAAEPTKVGTST
jgi:hypothetical protein